MDDAPGQTMKADSVDTPAPDGWPVPGWARYRCLALIGAGGMGRVYKAWDETLNRPVAVKFLSVESPELARRFFREARAQARIEHPNVGKVYEVGEAGGHPYIAMQFIPGESLQTGAADLTIEQKALVIRQVAEGVQAAHRLGLIHRDLKPANIILERTEDGQLRPTVVDFGLVREAGGEELTMSGQSLGTPSFMAPEQALGDHARVDRRTDVYGLGATLFTLLTGEPPFTGQSALEVIIKVTQQDPPSPRRRFPLIPRDLEIIVQTCLEKEPNRRYDSARALADALSRFLDGEAIQARRSSLGYRLRKRIQKNKALFSLGAAALLVTFVLLGMWGSARRSATRQAELAQRFGHRLERLEGAMWREQSLKPHNVVPALTAIRKSLAEIEAEVKAAGADASGPGYLALGRGYLALSELARARACLEKAWVSGYRTPDTAYALGLVLGKLYQHEFQVTQQISGKQEREERRERIRKELRDPAYRFLASSQGAEMAAPDYLKALLAYYEEDYETALAQARQAIGKIHWLYEAKVLEGDIYRSMNWEANRKGRAQKEPDYSAAAEQAYREALDIAPSDIHTYARLIALLVHRQNMAIFYSGEVRPELFTHPLEVGETAFKVYPDHPGILAELAAAHVQRAEYQLRGGHDPSDCLADAQRLTERALRYIPDDPDLLQRLGEIQWEQGKYALLSGRDPLPLFEQGIRHLERSLRINPRSSGGLGFLGLTYLDKATWEISRDLDPLPSLAHARRAFKESTRLYPKELHPQINLAFVEEATLEYQVRHKLEGAAATAARAQAILAQARRINPQLFWISKIDGYIHKHLARLRADRGKDPGPEVRQAVDCFQEVLRSTPEDMDVYQMLAGVLLIQARFEVAEGRSPRSLAGEAEKVLRRGLTLNPAHAGLLERLAEVKRLAVARPASAQPTSRKNDTDSPSAVASGSEAPP